MNGNRTIEVFSAGCPVCKDTIQMVNRVATSSCEVRVLDMKDETVSRRARELGIRSVPAVVIDGKLASCFARRSPDQETVNAARLGWPAD